MELESRIAELGKRASEHREVLLTEEAAKNALVMPFLQILGYDVFNPGEVIPEFTCDVGTKKGEKVDYAIRLDGKLRLLIECKPINIELNINHASQLFRYFSVTDARVAILTNGVIYKFYSDIDVPNKMDDRPFFTVDLDNIRKQDIRTLSNFLKSSFDIEKIVEEAGNLKMQSLVYKELQKEFDDPSEDFIRLVASKVHSGKITANIKGAFKSLIQNSINSLIRDRVTERLTSALNVSNPMEEVNGNVDVSSEDGVVTTEDEVSGFNIVRAILAKIVDPKRVFMRDAKSYCAILLDDNNRKTIVRLHFNSATARYLGVFSGKDERRISVSGPIDIYQHDVAILARVVELEGQGLSA